MSEKRVLAITLWQKFYNKYLYTTNYHMSKDEIKKEINKVLDLLPDKALEDLLSFRKNIEGNSQAQGLFLDSSRLNRILNEDKELLLKLAQ